MTEAEVLCNHKRGIGAVLGVEQGFPTALFEGKGTSGR
jgi:hypothetical protein